MPLRDTDPAVGNDDHTLRFDEPAAVTVLLRWVCTAYYLARGAAVAAGRALRPGGSEW